MLTTEVTTLPRPRWAVTLYSFTNELMDGAMTSDEVLRTAVAETGAEGVEVDAAQHFASFPAITASDAGRTREAIEASGASPTMFGGYLDLRIDHRGPRTFDEARAFLLHQLEAASAIGFFGVRVGVGAVPTAMLESLLPDLERLDVKILEEVQGGAQPDSPVLDRTRELRSRLDTDRVGFVFDASLVMAGLPVTWIRTLQASGVPDSVIDTVDQLWREHASDGWQRTLELVAPLHLPARVLRRLEMPFRRFGCTTVAQWRDFIGEVDSVHLKYWDLVDDDERVSRPTRELRAALAGVGYTGYVCSEWGGHDWMSADEAPAAEMTRGHRAVWDAAA